jgi:hypothetical protein
LPDFAKRTSEAAILRVENPRNTQVLLAFFSLNLTTSGQKPVISSIFKQALGKKRNWYYIYNTFFPYRKVNWVSRRAQLTHDDASPLR